MALLNIIVKT